MIKINQMDELIQLKYNCQEDLDSMSKTEKGKFCNSCQKEVIDFTKMSYAQIQKIRGNESKMCGIYLAEQVDPSLHPIELPKARSFAFLTTLLVSLNFSTVSAQSTVDPKVEQSQGSSNAPNLTPEEAKEKTENGQHISLSKASPTETESNNSDAEVEKKKAERVKKWYWSKRFPFLHKKRRRRHMYGF